MWKMLFRLFGANRGSLTNFDSLKPESTDKKIERLESKVNILLLVAVVQSVMVVILLGMNFLPSASTITMLVILFIILCAVFHKQLPGAVKWMWGVVLSLLADKDDKTSTDSQHGARENF